MALTAKKVEKIMKAGRYGDGFGLYLQVTQSGVKSWLQRFERNGRERWMGLGALHTLSLAEARDKSRKARQQLLDGVDPIEARKAEHSAQAIEAAMTMTFRECAHGYFNAHERGWRSAKHRKQFLATLEQYAFPIFGGMPAAAIDTGLVLKVLEPIWWVKTETANRVRGRIENVLDWATVRKYRSGENPARWKGHLDEVLPARGKIAKPKHYPALPFAETPEFMAQLSTRVGVAARALEFTILTAARTAETMGARWSEIDLAEKSWTVPANRTKGGREHRVPLSDRAVAILKALPREADFVFPGGRKDYPISNMAMDAVMKRMGYKEGRATVHGFRSTFRDWAAERTRHDNHIVEMALAHAVGSKVEAAYRRGILFDKRRPLMAEWARYCSTPQRTATITPMVARGA